MNPGIPDRARGAALGLAFALAALVGGAGPAGALDVARPLHQFRHTRWTLAEGAPGNIRAIVQGRDGDLWLGTATGLYRFDGIRFERLVPDKDDPRRSLQVTALHAARNGDIWVGYDFGGFGVVRGGRLIDANPWAPRGGVHSIVETRDGSIWFAADARGRLLLTRRDPAGRWTRVGPPAGWPEGIAGPAFAASDGSLYLVAPPAVFRLRPGVRGFERLAATAAPSAALAEDRLGRIWIADDAGLRPLPGTGASRAATPALALAGVNTPYVVRRLAIDHDGGMWIAGQDDGIVRVVPGGSGAGSAGRALTAETLSAAGGMTATLALSSLEDREGNIWIGTVSGLDRLAPANVARADGGEAMVTGIVGDRAHARIFFAGLSGVYRAARDRAPELIVRRRSIGVLCGDARRLLAISLDGAFRIDLSPEGAATRVTRVAGPLSVTCAIDAAGDFWTGMDRVYRLQGAALIPAAGQGGETGPTVMLLRPGPAGGLFMSRSLTGLFALNDGRAALLWRPQPEQSIGSITTLTDLGGGVQLLGGARGLARVAGGRGVVLSERDYPFLAGVTGVRRTADGATWVIGAMGIVRMASAALDAAFARPGTPIAVEWLGREDGYRARSNVFDSNDIVEDASGRLWFATNRGLAWIDRDRLVHNRLAPPVVIRSLAADGRPRAIDAAGLRLPAGTARVQIDYAGLSLTDAPANRFRYRLEGAERDWVEAGGERQALYTNLAPGRYRFRVIAANNEGVWNREGAAIDFEIAPFFWQTRWFLALCIAAGAAAAWALYRWRVRAVAAGTRDRIEAQMAERERIARELHDTLLQGFQGLMLRFQAGVEQIAPGDRARATIEGALERADDVLMESRDRVRTLREGAAPVPLEPHLRAVAMRTVQPVAPTLAWGIAEAGTPRAVCAPVADEIGAVVGEALANIVRHAGARLAEIRIRYGRERLEISVTDDGCGLPPALRDGAAPAGHYGLIGMRERAQRLGGTIDIAARAEGGTEIRLSVPNRVAYR